MSLPLRTLYPEIEPFDSGFLQVSPLHTLYYEQSGNPDGKPVVFLHGGPVAAPTPTAAGFLTPPFTALCCSISVDAASPRPMPN